MSPTAAQLKEVSAASIARVKAALKTFLDREPEEFEEDDLRLLVWGGYTTPASLASAREANLEKLGVRPARMDAILTQKEAKASAAAATVLAAGIAGSSPVMASYVQRLRLLRSPSKFGQYWPDFQLVDDPLFHCPRPSQAQQGLPPGLVDPVFAKFGERARSIKLDIKTCSSILKLAEDMSTSYISTHEGGAKTYTQSILGSGHLGKARGGEDERADIFRRSLGELLQHFTEAVTEIVPTSVGLSTNAKTDGTLTLFEVGASRARHVIAHPVNLEVKEDTGGNACMQLGCYYALLLADRPGDAAVRTSCFPQLGVELYGNLVRFWALYFTDKVNIMPLSPPLSLEAALRDDPQQMATLARTFKAFALNVLDLVKFYDPFQNDNQTGLPRDLKIEANIPYMLHRHPIVTQLCPSKLLYLCRDADNKPTHLAKLLPTGQYAHALHKELADKGFAPALRTFNDSSYPGFMLVEMDYLDEKDGWTELSKFSGDAAALRLGLDEARKALHACLNNKAVHGDLRRPNIFVRTCPAVSKTGPSSGGEHATASAAALDIGSDTGGAGIDSDTHAAGAATPSTDGAVAPADGAAEVVQVMFIDFDWGGTDGQVFYPAFMSHKVAWPISDPVEQPIFQAHDCTMLDRSYQQFLDRPSPSAAARDVRVNVARPVHSRQLLGRANLSRSLPLHSGWRGGVRLSAASTCLPARRALII